MPGVDQPAMTQRHYSKFRRPTIAMSELVCKTLDHDAADVLIDKWLEHPNHSYWDWFERVRERKHQANQRDGPQLSPGSQLLLWNKGDFVPENVFSRTVDTGRLIPLDRTWSTHVYHHHSLQDRKLSMMPVVFTMVRIPILPRTQSTNCKIYQLPELMLLRGMHDHGSDDIYIIVTDLKRQEMDDVAEYFKLVCRATYRRTDSLKPSLERQIEHERQSSRDLLLCRILSFVRIRHANNTYPQSTKTYSLFPANRHHLPCDTLREEAALHHTLLPSTGLIL
jgi:hypothetical protein